MTKNVRIRLNSDSGYEVAHPETNTEQVLHTDGNKLSEVIIRMTNSENINIGQIEGIASNTLQGAIQELNASLLMIKNRDVVRVSHSTPAELTSPVSLQLNRSFTAGPNYDLITLVEDNNPDMDLITSKTTSSISIGSAFTADPSIINLSVDNGFSPNRDYTCTIPLEALKDANGNDIAGDYTFKFRTKSVIAEAGSLLDLVAEVNDEGTEVSISWTNPQGVDLVNIVCKRDTVGYVTDMNSGTTVYDAIGTSFVDNDVALDTEYYYTFFTIDSVGQFNNTSRIKVLVEDTTS